VPFKANKDSPADWVGETNFRIAGQNQFTVGRVIAPFIDANMEQPGFFAFDILLIPDVSFFKSSMLSYILLLAFVYFLVNLLVIRRMVKFGSEINQVIVQKFNQLKNGIREISTGNLDYKVRLEGEDEFVELADRFNQMGDKLKASIAEAREKERLQHELKIAREVQLSMLPLDLPEVPGYQIAATLKTANEVGGDFYDVLSLDKNRYLFTVGDVSGKGTSAAFYMAQCLSIIRSSQQFTKEPGDIVIRLNKYFAYPLIDRELFVTAVVGVLDLKKACLRFVRAGHTPPIFIPGNRQKSIHELESTGLGIGLERIGNIFEQQLETVDVSVRSGDMIIFYTDGVVEAARSNSSNDRGDDSEMQFYGHERFMNLLNELRGKNASDILQALKDDLESFYGEESPVDDYTLLIIQKT
jgi:serine phosphatase RsbU (regulator of sigma subunit)/HAMP domain-containing protein